MRIISPILATLLVPLVATLPLAGQQITGQEAVPTSSQGGAAPQLRVITTGVEARTQAGSASSAPIAVEVKDASGAPVTEAAVVFRLPDSGPSGTFGGGTLTSVVYTDATGRANAGSVQWGSAPGVVPVRITVAKGTGHAGVLFSETLTGSAGAAPTASAPTSPVPQPVKVAIPTPNVAAVQVQPRPGALAASDVNSPPITVEHLGPHSVRSRKPQPAEDDEETPQTGSSPTSNAAAYADDGSPDANVPIRHAFASQGGADSLDAPGVSVTHAGAGEQSVSDGHHLKKWLIIAGVIAGGGAAFALTHKGSSSTSSSGTTIGTPSISVGHP